MPKITAEVHCPIRDSFRVRQVAGMFDLTVSPQTSATFEVELPGLDEPWSIGLIVGPSGSGKTTIARHAFGDCLSAASEWPSDRAVIDCFGERTVKEITHTLSSVGFSSPPAWLRPYAVLSNGEKFRCDLARSLFAEQTLCVFDEFTSVVDRTVARIGSAAVSKAIRSGRINRRFVAVSCHYDIADWLEPDWVLDMASGKLARGRLRRPEIKLVIQRVHHSAWNIFKRHHYLSSELNKAAACFVAMIDGSPAAFCGVLPFPHPTQPGWREHRTVCLPDFQGLGVGHALAEFVASLFAARGRPYTSVTSHPAMIRHRARSALWRMLRGPSRASVQPMKGLAATSSFSRLTAGFRYVGPTRRSEADNFGVGRSRKQAGNRREDASVIRPARGARCGSGRTV
jgi:energy-coupling factor transporter ATP-binding protein EcfA2